MTLPQPVSRVMPLKVLNEHLVYAVRSRRVAAGVSHGAPTAIEILPHYHRNFPQSWIRSRGTGWYHTVVEELVIQRVRPAGRSVLIDGHGRIVREVCVPEHLEHIVTADLEKYQVYNILSDLACCFIDENTFVIACTTSCLLHNYYIPSDIINRIHYR